MGGVARRDAGAPVSRRLRKIRRHTRNRRARFRVFRRRPRLLREFDRVRQRHADMVAVVKRRRPGGEARHPRSRRIRPPSGAGAALRHSVPGHHVGRADGDNLDAQGLGKFFQEARRRGSARRQPEEGVAAPRDFAGRARTGVSRQAQSGVARGARGSRNGRGRVFRLR